MEELNE